MNLEPSARSHAHPSDSSLTPADAPQLTRQRAEQLSQDFSGELDADSIEASLARASTLMLDFQPEAFELPSDSHKDEPNFKYVQGIVQAQQAFIITNLLGEESEILLQPQRVWTIGRNREAALSLQDPMMSRRHAVILYTKNEGFYLIDLNSMNGTFLNGVKVQHRNLLKDGDRICIGNIAFAFFTSHRVRSLEAIHPQVLARLNAPESRPAFIDYLASGEV